MSLRSKHHRQERIDRLHRAALDHIAVHGVQGLRLNTLAKDLGYTTAALYRYYSSKEALIAELQKTTLTMMQHALLGCLKEANLSSPLMNLLLSAHFYGRYAQYSPASFALNSAIFSNPTPILHGDRRQDILTVMQSLLTIIQRQIEDAGLAPDQGAPNALVPKQVFRSQVAR